jgi:hypothetical protein
MNGIATLYEARTGKELWKERLNGQFSSSPIVVNGLIYAQSEAGRNVRDSTERRVHAGSEKQRRSNAAGDLPRIARRHWKSPVYPLEYRSLLHQFIAEMTALDSRGLSLQISSHHAP